MGKTYKGEVVFVDGVHYPIEGEGADLTRPLRWEDGGYRDAEEGEPLHNETHHQREASVVSEPSIAEPGQAIYPVGVHVVSSGDGFYYLEKDDGTTDPNALRWDGETQTFRAAGGES